MSIAARGVGKTIGTPPTRILSDIDLEIKDGEFVALTGRSGAGKSTLLYLLSSLDNSTAGAIEVDGQRIDRMNHGQLCEFRNAKMGFVFQFHFLIAELSALENILLPARKFNQVERRRDYALSLLKEFGLGGKEERLPRQLSGGEMQRVAIARALVMEPKYLFADEPTGSLDTVNGDLVMDIIRGCNQKMGMTVIMVTHDPDFANLASRQIHLIDGRIAQKP